MDAAGRERGRANRRGSRSVPVAADPPAPAFGQTMVSETMVSETWELDLAGRQGAADASVA